MSDSMPLRACVYRYTPAHLYCRVSRMIRVSAKEGLRRVERAALPVHPILTLPFSFSFAFSRLSQVQGAA